MRTFLVWELKKFMLLFLNEKKIKTCLIYIQEQCICKLGKIQNELKLLFCVCHRFMKMYPGII